MASQTTQDGSPVDRLESPQAGIYLVSRTSYGFGKPCDEAYEVELVQVDRRRFDDPKKVPAHHGTDGDWYQCGSNHRVENGQICRDIGWYRTWAVQVDDVMKFVDAHGCCVVSRNPEGFAQIEIYDSYRE